MAQAVWPLTQRKFGETTRRDAWWLQPLLVFLALSTFIVYATWAAFQGNHFEFGPYLSPFYSPLLFGDSHHAWFGPSPVVAGSAAVFSGIADSVGARRLHSPYYYYRGATTKRSGRTRRPARSEEPRKSYLGERSLRSCSRTCTAIFSTLTVVHRHPDWRRDSVLLVHRQFGHRAFRNRCRQPDTDRQHRAPGRLHAQLPFAATPRWRRPG
jgi:hypothetical protein